MPQFDSPAPQATTDPPKVGRVELPAGPRECSGVIATLGPRLSPLRPPSKLQLVWTVADRPGRWGDEVNDGAGFQAFTVAFVAAFLLDFAEDWQPWPVALAFVALAIWVVSRPSVGRLTLWSALSAWWIVHHLPALSNHYSLYLLIAAAIVGAASVQSARARRLASGREIWPALRPALALTTVVMYFGAGFHKLNSAFFDPSVSCALDYADRFSLWYHLPALPRSAWAVAAVGGATLFWEVGGALALLMRRTQWLVLLICATAHGLLSLMMFYDFSALAIALFVSFVPQKGRARIDDRARVYGPSIIGLTMAAWGIHQLVSFANTQRIVGAAFVIVAGWFLLADFGSWRRVGAPVIERWHPVALLLPAAVLLLAATPYLGLRTTGNLSMFSNLRTEEGQTNHLVVPEGTQLFGYQHDVVIVQSDAGPIYNDRWEDISGFALVTTAVDAERDFLIDRNGDFDVTSGAAGASRSSISELPSSSNWLERTLLHFRPIQTSDEANSCRW